MKPALRKLTLGVHVRFSVGWLGAVVAYLALALVALTTSDVALQRGAYLSLRVVAWFVIVPAALGAFATGLIQSLGTEWGLVRHYWILAKSILTVIATAILLGHLPAIRRMAAFAADPATSLSDLGELPVQLVIHAAGAVVVLLAITTISVFKPWGRTPWGRRRAPDAP